MSFETQPPPILLDALRKRKQAPTHSRNDLGVSKRSKSHCVGYAKIPLSDAFQSTDNANEVGKVMLRQLDAAAWSVHTSYETYLVLDILNLDNLGQALDVVTDAFTRGYEGLQSKGVYFIVSFVESLADGAQYDDSSERAYLFARSKQDMDCEIDNFTCYLSTSLVPQVMLIEIFGSFNEIFGTYDQHLTVAIVNRSFSHSSTQAHQDGLERQLASLARKEGTFIFQC